MAKIIEQNLVIKFSKLVKDDASDNDSVVDRDVIANLEQVVQELAGESVIVEIIEE